MCHCLPVCELLHSIADRYLLKEIISWVSLSLYHGEMEKQTVCPCFQKSATFHIIPKNLAALKARVSHILLPNVFALETCDSFSALRAIIHQLCTHTPGPRPQCSISFCCKWQKMGGNATVSTEEGTWVWGGEGGQTEEVPVFTDCI